MENQMPLAEVFVETEAGNTRSEIKTGKVCLNCDTPLTDIYCPHCGQKDIERRQTIGDLFINFVSSFWSFESKFLNTGKVLLLNPGILSRDYTAGKRERYYHPARMYVFISFVYFLLFTTLPDKPDTPSTTEKQNNSNSDKEYVSGNLDSIETKYHSLKEYDSIQNTLSAKEKDNWIMSSLRKKEIQIKDKYKGKDQEFGKTFTEHFVSNTSKVFFFLLPVFALILKLLYVRRDFFYSEHLVFTVFFYDFFFLAGSIYMLVELIPGVSDFSWILVLWMFLYLLIAMKNMYQQSWRKTIFKYCTFLFVFSFCVLIGIALNMALTLMFI